ncbi:MAG: redoxin domain-containing protein [Bacteroidales bacterium]|nr:redoxin domain-containing protein [Bacteroidales bacterium]MCF8390121.1 redoxin domain-containing protein [Bacteroidales bacterium]
MKKLSFPFLLTILVLSIGYSASGQTKKRGEVTGGLPPDANTLNIGDPAPGFELLGIDGKTYTLADFKTANLLMVVFLSNHCPYSHAAETRLIPMVKEFKSQGLEVVAINPNNPESVRADELGYSKYNDSYEEMILYAKEAGFPFPYLYDGDKQMASKAYGCLATPHVFLFDKDRELRYAGRVDDSRFADPATVTSHDTRNAIEELLAGQVVTTPTTTVMGCSTKWNYKREDVSEAKTSLALVPVTILEIDAEGVAELAKNNSDRLRLVNVWATWCSPCVAEFPDLVAISQRLGNRPFEMITISMDNPKMKEQTVEFLVKHQAVPPNALSRKLENEGRTSLNYIYTGASSDAIIKALDTEWKGPLPFTVLIAPGGEIIYRQNGPVDPIELKNFIYDYLGGYYDK